MWIFLDIDGVLVPEKKFDQPVSEADFRKFDPQCLQAFEDVIRQFPQAKIVITSSWREIYPFEVIHPLFSLDIAHQVKGVTPFLDPTVIHQLKYLRHQEVLTYLQQNSEKNPAWIAVDDIPEHYPTETPIVVTDPYIGFDDHAAQVLCNWLATSLKHSNP